MRIARTNTKAHTHTLMREKLFACSVRLKIMKHNLTAEQIVYVMFGLLIFVSLAYVWIEGIKEKYYGKGYVHGWNRAKATYGQRHTR